MDKITCNDLEIVLSPRVRAVRRFENPGGSKIQCILKENVLLYISIKIWEKGDRSPHPFVPTALLLSDYLGT